MQTRSILAVLALIIVTEVVPGFLAAQTPGSVVTKTTLKATLENMGFEAKDLGANTYEITVNQGAVVPMSVSLSTDESKIWLITFFGEKVLANYSADKLLKLLQSNYSTTSFFAFDSSKLKMLHSIENRSITPVVLRKEIESHARSVGNTTTLWNDK